MVTSVVYMTGAPICNSESAVSTNETKPAPDPKTSALWRITMTRKAVMERDTEHQSHLLDSWRFGARHTLWPCVAPQGTEKEISRNILATTWAVLFGASSLPSCLIQGMLYPWPQVVGI